jgi:hypothetical protein
MYIRKATLKSLDPSDHSRLSNFVHALRTHSMYQPIVENLVQRPGFLQKEYRMVDNKEGQTFYSILVFESKEYFDQYFEDESSQSLWIALELMANQEGISFNIEDEEASVIQ